MFRPLTLFVAIVLLSGCSAKDAPKVDSAKTASQAGAPVAGAKMGSFDPTTRVAVVHAKDFAFDAPDSISAGWTTFHFVNDGPKLHHAQLVRLDSGKTLDDVAKFFQKPGPEPKWLVFVGGANAPDPGTQTDAAFNLTPGNYGFICLVDIPDHIPHAVKGMMRPLTVTAATGPATAPPASDMSVTLSDYSFTMNGTLTAGKHTLKVENKGPQNHELELLRLLPGKTMDDVKKFFVTFEGAPPVNGLAGVAVESPGMTGYVMLDLTPGNYVLYCFVPDAKDGKMHAEHGMVKAFTIN